MKFDFSFSHLPNLHFGAGKLNHLPEIISHWGNNILLVTGENSFSHSVYYEHLTSRLKTQHILWRELRIGHEPSPSDIDQGVQLYRDSLPDVVVAIGGGSVIDAGKALSAMLVSELPTVHYLEQVGDTQPTGKKVPFIAVPTTAGTGSEATKNAVISVVGNGGFKSSLRHDNYIPNVAIIDPELQLTCPASLTACSGMDAFSQLVESYLSTNANPMTDTLALDGIMHIVQSLEELVLCQPTNLLLRSKMAYAAWLSGITLANAGLGTVHGFASSVGATTEIPHGTVCGSLMAETNKITLQELKKSNELGISLQKYATLGRITGKYEGKPNDFLAEYFIDYLEQLTEKLKLPKLGQFGVKGNDIESIASKTSNKNNPVKLSHEQLVKILVNRL